jgi:hypothetical protein
MTWRKRIWHACRRRFRRRTGSGEKNHPDVVPRLSPASLAD